MIGKNDITVKYATNNPRYKDQVYMDKVQWLVLHDNGCAAPPIPNWVSRQNSSTATNLVEYWMDDVDIYKIAPNKMWCWHVGTHKGTGKSLNSISIGVEVSPKNKYNQKDFYGDAEYFKIVYKRAVELFAYLCKQEDVSVYNIVSHAEAHAMGKGCNHADVHRWFDRYDVTMDDFREDVRSIVGEPRREYINYKVNNTTAGRSSLAYYSLPKEQGGKWQGAFKNGTVVTKLDIVGNWLYGQVTEDYKGNPIDNGKMGYFDMGFMLKNDYVLIKDDEPIEVPAPSDAEEIVKAIAELVKGYI